MTRSNAIQLIHIAKGQLALDDDTYRALLGRQFWQNQLQRYDGQRAAECYSGAGG